MYLAKVLVIKCITVSFCGLYLCVHPFHPLLSSRDLYFNFCWVTTNVCFSCVDLFPFSTYPHHSCKYFYCSLFFSYHHPQIFCIHHSSIYSNSFILPNSTSIQTLFLIWQQLLQSENHCTTERKYFSGKNEP